jgi:hypothetical protein
MDLQNLCRMEFDERYLWNEVSRPAGTRGGGGGDPALKRRPMVVTSLCDGRGIRAGARMLTATIAAPLSQVLPCQSF